MRRQSSLNKIPDGGKVWQSNASSQFVATPPPTTSLDDATRIENAVLPAMKRTVRLSHAVDCFVNLEIALCVFSFELAMCALSSASTNLICKQKLNDLSFACSMLT